MSRGIAVREALINEIALIHKNRDKQKQDLGKVEALKGQVRDKAESLSKFRIAGATELKINRKTQGLNGAT